jgi:hypothetical protein
MATRFERRSSAARGVTASALVFAHVCVACVWEPASVRQVSRGQGRIVVLDRETVSFEAEVELILQGDGDQSVALDALCVTVGSGAAGFDGQTRAVVEEVELDRDEWPVELSKANGYSERRSLRVRGTAAMSLDSPTHPCRAGQPSIQVGAVLIGSEQRGATPNCAASGSDFTVELECPPCTDPVTELGLASTWAKPGDAGVAVAQSQMLVDAAGDVWRIGPPISNERRLLRTSAEDESAEASATEAPLEMRGRVTLAGGSIPGLLRGHAVGLPYLPEEQPEPPSEGQGGGGGGGGEEPTFSDPLRSMRIAFTDSEGERWSHDFETAAYDIDIVAPAVAASGGRVIAMVFGPRGLYVDGELLAPPSSTEVYLVALDEATGELIDFVEFEHPLFSVQALRDGAFVAVAGVEPGIFALMRIESDLQMTWITPLPEEPLDFLEMAPDILAVDGLASYWSSPRGPLYRFDHAGEVVWRIDPPWQITSMAIAPDGGLLLTSPMPVVAWLGPDGGFHGMVDRRDGLSCPFQMSFATGGREPAYARSLDSIELGRLGAAP